MFCVMRSSPNCDIFYCIIILKIICLVLLKSKNWNIIYRLCMYVIMKFENGRCRNASI